MKKALISFILILLAAAPIRAQTLSLSVWPPILEVTLQPGKTITQVYRIKNAGDDTVVTAKIVPFEADGELGQIKLSTTPDPALGYITLQNADFELNEAFTMKSGASQELVVKVNVPTTASAGDHYLTLLFESDSEYLLSGSGAKAAGSIGANILLTVTETEITNQTAKIETLSLPCFMERHLCLMDSFDQFEFLVRAKNTTSHWFKIIGQLTITNTFGRQITSLPFREDNILAQSVRALQPETKWQPVLPLGRYVATATITPENSINTISQTLTFWVLPYKALLVLALVSGFYYLIKTKKRIII